MGVVDGKPHVAVQALGRLVAPLHTQIYGLHASLFGADQYAFQKGRANAFASILLIDKNGGQPPML